MNIFLGVILYCGISPDTHTNTDVFHPNKVVMPIKVMSTFYYWVEWRCRHAALISFGSDLISKMPMALASFGIFTLFPGLFWFKIWTHQKEDNRTDSVSVQHSLVSVTIFNRNTALAVSSCLLFHIKAEILVSYPWLCTISCPLILDPENEWK